MEQALDLLFPSRDRACRIDSVIMSVKTPPRRLVDWGKQAIDRAGVSHNAGKAKNWDYRFSKRFATGFWLGRIPKTKWSSILLQP